MSMAFQHRLPWLLPRPSWSEDLDFVGPRVRTAWWAWLVLGLGAMVVLMAYDAMAHTQQALIDAEQQHRRLSLADRGMRLTRALQARETVAQAAVAPPLTPADLPEVASMARTLAYPWAQALGQIDADAWAQQVVLLSLSVDLDQAARAAAGGTGTAGGALAQPMWRLQAAVRHDADALAWSARMPGGQILSRERLQQPFTGLLGRYDLKVDAQMPWPQQSTPEPAVAPGQASTGMPKERS